jgi:hypothetical protein
MMRRSVVYPIFFLAALGAAGTKVSAQSGDVAVTNLQGQARFSADQLDNLTGPVALYPDALLAQVLVAATFPDQVSDAAAFVRTNGTADIDSQGWDISVKAVAHYPSALNAMADKLDWTTALGQAYASQSSEVMQSVQRLRSMASANGNLNTTQQQQVIQQGATYQIVPVQPQVIYVPVYDPYVIYSRPVFNVGYSSRFWSFGVGFPIGSWLSYDCDWGTQRVYYNGWAPQYYGYSSNWRMRSQPYIQVTNIYVSPRYRNVYINRTVVNHEVDYRNVDRYASVHSGQRFEGRYDNRDGGRQNGNNYPRGTNGGDRTAVRGGVAQNGGGYTAGRNGQINDANNGRNNNVINGRGGNRDNNNNNNNNINSPRTAVAQQRRNEPAQRMDGQQPELVVPPRANNNSNRGADGQYQIRRQGQMQQRAPQQQQQGQMQQRAPQQQQQVQVQAQPQQQSQVRVAQPRQAEQRQAPQGAVRTAPPRAEQPARQAEPRSDRGRGGEENRGDASRHRGGM